MLKVGSYTARIPANSFRQNSKGNYSYEGTIQGMNLELQIAPKTPTTYTLRAEVTGNTPLVLDEPPVIVLRVGNDIGAGAAAVDH